MCLVKVYVKEPGQSDLGEPAFSDVARIEYKDDKIVVIGLFGESKSLNAEVRTIDFVENRVIIERQFPDIAPRNERS